MELVKYILGEFSVIRAAPVSFALSILAAALLIFYLMVWGYGRENSYLRTQVDDYKEKLKGATPAEARDRINELESAVGRKWPALTPAQATALSRELTGLEKLDVRIMYENLLGKDLGESIHQAFVNSGWPTVSITPGAGFGRGISYGHGRNGLPVKDAIERVTPLRLTLFQPVQLEVPGIMIIAIGINSVAP